MKKPKPALKQYLPEADYNNAGAEAQKQADAFVEEVDKRVTKDDQSLFRFTREAFNLYSERCTKKLSIPSFEFKSIAAESIFQELRGQKTSDQALFDSVQFCEKETLLLAQALSKKCVISDEFLRVARSFTYFHNMGETIGECIKVTKRFTKKQFAASKNKL